MIKRTLLFAAGMLFCAFGAHAQSGAKRPNILFVVAEDMNLQLGLYGDKTAITPNLDAFAKQAIRYDRAFSTAPVCAPSRSAIITGVHQQTLGTHQMRTRGAAGLPGGAGFDYDAVPPADVKAFPELLRAAGYYVTNGGLGAFPLNAKTDYQIGEPFTIWDDSSDKADWKNRGEGQPFFAMVTLFVTHESYLWPYKKWPENRLQAVIGYRNLKDLAFKPAPIDPASVSVPPYLPDTPAVRADIARHYNNIFLMDREFGRLMERLRAEGLDKDTIVVFTADNGTGLPRAKRAIYDSGIHMPLLVRYPDGRGAGTETAELVSFVDFAPSFLALAGVPRPAFIQGRDFLSATPDPAPAMVFAAADRHDNVMGRYKTVRTDRLAYVRNFMPEKPFFEHLTFRDQMPSMQELWRLLAAGGLNDVQKALFESPRPSEELYDLAKDPDQIKNLADDPAYAAEKARLSAAMDDWLVRTGDLSALPEREMVERWWPGLVQPVTAAPEAKMEDGKLLLASTTGGASIGWRAVGDPKAPWKLYAGPLSLAAGMEIEAKAIRYGYAESPPARLKAQ